MNACFGRTPSLPWRPLYTPAIPPVPAVQPRVACLPSETLALCPATDRPRPEARVPSWTLYGRSAAESCPSCHGHDAPQLAIPVLIGDCDFGDQERFRNGSWAILTAGPGLEPYPRGYPQPDCRSGAGSAGTQPAGTGGALHGRGKILCLRGFGLSVAESARSHRQPGLHRHQGGRGVPGQNHGAEPALTDRLQLSQDHGLGLVLSLHRAGRFLALHRRLEALRDDESAGRDRHARPGIGGLRA
jgi:hypothetical protein